MKLKNLPPRNYELNQKAICYTKETTSHEDDFDIESNYNIADKCDLLWEKGPTAVKRRFKTQLTAFSL